MFRTDWWTTVVVSWIVLRPCQVDGAQVTFV
jgi:hypothetical protein